MKLALVLALAACGGGGPRFLGAPVPAACRAAGTFDACFGETHTLQVAAQLGIVEDSELRDYVQRVADRVARGTRMGRAPRVAIEDFGSTAYVGLGPRLAVSRNVLGWIGSEADLAGILAHELAHIEGRHAQLALESLAHDDTWYQSRRDAEASADERGFELLVRAGYQANALERLYGRKGPDGGMSSDGQHPTLEDAIARQHRLASKSSGGIERRAELLAATEGLVVGRDTSFGTRIGDVWVIPRLGLTTTLPGAPQQVSGNRVWTSDGTVEYTFDLVSRAYADELAATLLYRRARKTPVGEVVIGVMPRLPVRDDDPIAHALDVWRDEVWRPPVGANVAIVQRKRGALIFELVTGAPATAVDATVGRLRVATQLELAAAAPSHIVLATAAKTATIRELAKTCAHPESALEIDDPERVIQKGERFKCTDRKIAPW